MKVKAVYHAVLSQILGCDTDTIELDSLTLGGLINDLEQRYGDRIRELHIRSANADKAPWVLILVNGRRVALSVELRDGDEVDFLMPIAGG